MRLALVENSLDAIMIFDEKGRFLLVNKAAEELLGHARAELVGRRVWKGLLPAEVERLLKGKRKKLLLLETEITTASEEKVPIRLAGVALRPGGSFTGSAVIAQDLREIKRLEREKLDAERLAAVGETVAGIAHGIKNILTGLQGGMYVASLGMQHGDVERIKEGWEMLTRNMNRISELTRNLLAFSRGEPFECTLVDPAEVVRDVVALYQDSAARHGIELVAEIQAGIEPASMDSAGMHGCLTNLISNAVDAYLHRGYGHGLRHGLRGQAEGFHQLFHDQGQRRDRSRPPADPEARAAARWFHPVHLGARRRHDLSAELSKEPAAATYFTGG